MVVDDDHAALSLQVVEVAQSLHLLKGDQHIGRALADYGGVDLFAVADLRRDAAAALAHAVYLAHLDVIAGLDERVAKYLAGQNGALAADAAEDDVFNV